MLLTSKGGRHLFFHRKRILVKRLKPIVESYTYFMYFTGYDVKYSEQTEGREESFG